MEWRHPCYWEAESDCGWIYLGADMTEIWVTCDDFYSTNCLNECYNEWYWEDCSQMSWRLACDWEAESDDGWIYQKADMTEIWVDRDDFYATDCLSECNN